MASITKSAPAYSSNYSQVDDQTYNTGTSVSWTTNFSRLVASDNSDLSCSTDIVSTTAPQTHRLDIKNWGFLAELIPPGSTIEGFEATVEFSSTQAGRHVGLLQCRLLIDGSPAGDNKGTGQSNTSTTDITVTVGGSTDLWGLTPTDTQIRSDQFGLAIQFYTTSNNTKRVDVDHVTLTVYYTPAAVGSVTDSIARVTPTGWVYETSNTRSSVTPTGWLQETTAPASGGGITATLAVTEAGDTLASTTTVKVAATLSVTESDDTLSSTSTVLVTGTSAVTEVSDTVSSTSTVLVVGTSSITEDADTVSSTLTVSSGRTASADITEADDTLSSTSTVLVSAQASQTEANDTVASTITIVGPVSAEASITEENDTSTSTGTVLVTSTASITEASDTVSSTVVVLRDIEAIASIIEASDNVVSILSIPRTGNAGGMSSQENDAAVRKRLRRLALQQAHLEDDEEALAILLATVMRK